MAPHHGVALAGLAAVALVLLNSGLALPRQNVSAVVSIVPAADATPSAFEPIEVMDKPEYHALARYLSQRYRIATDSARSVVGAAYDAGEQCGLDPLLLLAVMAVESRFNPVARSVMGARGLMQIMPGQHRDKLAGYGGENAVLDPMINIMLGAQILKEYIGRSGNLKAGLQFYNGARSDAANRYSRKVIAERDRLQGVVRELQQTADDGMVKSDNSSVSS
jgi:soluble lytic murein transglycosylase-like protein